MASSYSNLGLLWCALSFVAAAVSVVGFFFPHWLRGAMRDPTTGAALPVYLSTFRRCNYPVLDADTGAVAVVRECGRYTTFSDIPSSSWRVSCVVCGVGCGVSALACLVGAAGCCVGDLVSTGVARTLGATQLAAGLAIGAACALYPHGWGAKEVRDVCGGDSDSFRAGSCRLAWAFYVTVGGAALNLLCFFLSFGASQMQKRYRSVYREDRL